jgi:hypothetical protein
MLYIVFLIAIIIICAFANSFIKLRENYIDIDTKTVPAPFYDQSTTAQNFNLAECGFEFFDTVLKNNINILTTATDNNTYLLTILNRNFETEKANIFNIVKTQKNDVDPFTIVDTKIISQTATTTTSEHLVYRPDKIYGINIHITTENLKDTNQMRLIDYSIPGFVFDDKIEMNDPANIVISDTPYQPFMKDETFMKDTKYEQTFLCNYYDNLAKNGHIIVNPGFDCANL